MNISFEYMTHLQYRLAHAERRIKSFESGDEYQKLKLGKSRQRIYYERELKRRDAEITSLRRHVSFMTDMWFQVFEDVQKDCEKRILAMDRIIEDVYRRLAENERQYARLEEKYRQKLTELTDERSKVCDREEKIQKLTAQVNQSFENSSIPSSQSPFRKKVPNNRIRTGRHEGGQTGHPGHGRTAMEPTAPVIVLDAPEEVRNNPDFYALNGEAGTIRKQVIGIRFEVIVTEYQAKVYRNRKTGGRYHAPFPEGVQLDVNYDESVKALVFLLRNHLNVSIDKTQEFLKELTGGKLCISHGKISGINEEFARKTTDEQAQIFNALLHGDIMYTDMTNVRHNGKLKPVVICTDKENIYYGFRDQKGDAGLKGTPVEYFLHLLVHDHDKTYYHYGEQHQECNAHHTRYLRGAMENEPHLTWHEKMLDLLLEMDATREKQNRKYTEEQIAGYLKRYEGILALAAREYEDYPPSAYYRKGFNLSRELLDYQESTLRFLSNPEVDFSNNESERGARKIKRHTVATGSFRGKDNRSGEDYCAAMSVLQTDRQKGENIYQNTVEYFKRNAVIRPKKKTTENEEAAPE